MTYYLLRFDDINPKMNWERFYKIKSVVNKYNKITLKSSQNVMTMRYQNFENKNYISQLQMMKSNGDLIAQHGYTYNRF